jgi:cysteinyl-tRNA synthetase, unknown class
MATPVNGIYVLQGIVPSQIATAPVGPKVVDLYDDNGDLFSSSQVAQMESGGWNVLGYFSIGEAENYRPYWSSLPSSVLGPQDPSWPGDYQVAYWTPQWLTVSENYIQTMINQGYKGAFFDVVDEAETAWAKNNAPNGDAEGAMVTLIQELTNYAHARDPSFQIWINSSGAEPMLSNSTLVNTINGAFEEQLFYKNATQAESSTDVNFNLGLLDNLVNAGKPVVAVEYVSGASEVSSVEAQAKADGIGYYIANPNLQLDGVDTQGFTSGSGSGSTPGTAPAVAITSKGVTTASAAQTITGTVDVADAGSTVTILDGATKIGSATVAATGAWSANVTLAKQGANALTATDTNAAGTGTSSAVTYTLAAAPPKTAPAVAITSKGVTTASAAQTITGTVDVTDAGSTVTILDGTTKIGAATVAATGGWSTNVTLPKQGANVITATDTNAAGTGTSSAVTYTLASITPTPPTLTIANSTLSVTGRGGTVGLGISVTAPASSTATTVKIQGLPSYERTTDNYDGKIFKGASITLSEAEVDSGLTLTSRYKGSGHPSATLTVTASDTIGGVTSVSAPRTLTVNDPPPSASAATASTDGFHGFALGHNAGLDADIAWHVSGAGHDTGLAALLSGGNMGFEHGSARGDERNHLGLNIAAFGGRQL